MADQPTKEEFEAAAREVMGKAPDGLSREQFLDAIDRQLKLQTLQKANATPLKEPTTWLGGFLKSANDQMGELGRGAFESAAHPGVDVESGTAKPKSNTLADLTGLLLPTSLPMAVKGLRAAPELAAPIEPVGNKVLRFGARRAADALDLTPKIISNPLEDRASGALRAFGERKPVHPAVDTSFSVKSGVGSVPDNGLPQEQMPTSSVDHSFEVKNKGSDLWGGAETTGGEQLGPPSPTVESPASDFPHMGPEGAEGDWHSGAEPGSAEAKSARAMHKVTRELDDLYKYKIDNPLAALLMSIMGGGAVGARNPKEKE